MMNKIKTSSKLRNEFKGQFVFSTSFPKFQELFSKFQETFSNFQETPSKFKKFLLSSFQKELRGNGHFFYYESAWF